MEQFNLPKAGRVTELGPIEIEDMSFHIELFKDPFKRLRAMREQLIETGVPAKEADMSMAKVIPIIIEALEKNPYNVDSSAIPAAFRVLMGDVSVEQLELTRAVVTVLREIGVAKSSAKAWQIEDFNGGEDTEERRQLFMNRMRIIEEVYGAH